MIAGIVARIGRRRNRMNPILRETLRMGETDRFYRHSDVVLARVLTDRNKLAFSRRFAAAFAE
jgi:hypothetical protein